MAKKKNKGYIKKLLNVKYIIMTKDEHQLFLCYDHAKSSIEFIKEFEDKISLFPTKKAAMDFINHFGKQIKVPMIPLEIPLGELLDDSKVSHILENISQEKFQELIEKSSKESVWDPNFPIPENPYTSKGGENNDMVGD